MKSSAVLLLAILACSGRSGPPRLYDVEQVAAHEAELSSDAELHVRGKVVAGSVQRDGATTRFILIGMAGGNARLHAEIPIAPDTLRDGNDGVVTGRLVRDSEGWRLRATSVVMRAGGLPR